MDCSIHKNKMWCTLILPSPNADHQSLAVWQSRLCIFEQWSSTVCVLLGSSLCSCLSLSCVASHAHHSPPCVVSHLSPPLALPVLDLCYFSCACPSSPRRQYRGAHPDSTGGEETAHQPPAPSGRGPRYDAYIYPAVNSNTLHTCDTQICYCIMMQFF